MASPFDITKLAAMIRAKRGDRGLREISDEIKGVSASTLSRVEQGNIPDVETFARLTRWLGVSADEFVVGGDKAKTRAPAGPELIEANLRADRTLPPKAADALAKIVRFAYDAAIKSKHR